MIFMAGRLINQHFGPIDVRGINASEAVRKQTLLKQELNNDKIAPDQVQVPLSVWGLEPGAILPLDWPVRHLRRSSHTYRFLSI